MSLQQGEIASGGPRTKIPRAPCTLSHGCERDLSQVFPVHRRFLSSHGPGPPGHGDACGPGRGRGEASRCVPASGQTPEIQPEGR